MKLKTSLLILILISACSTGSKPKKLAANVLSGDRAPAGTLEKFPAHFKTCIVKLLVANWASSKKELRGPLFACDPDINASEPSVNYSFHFSRELNQGQTQSGEMERVLHSLKELCFRKIACTQEMSHVPKLDNPLDTKISMIYCTVSRDPAVSEPLRTGLYINRAGVTHDVPYEEVKQEDLQSPPNCQSEEPATS